jgi:hypothetical protein
VRAYAAHPGYAATNLQGRTGNRIADRLVKVANKIIAQSEEQGALPILFAATQDLPGAAYVGPHSRNERREHPTLVGRSTAASDVELAKNVVEGVGRAHRRELSGGTETVSRLALLPMRWRESRIHLRNALATSRRETEKPR